MAINIANATGPGPRSGTVLVHKDGALAWVVIGNASRMNALSAAMWAELPRAIEEAVADPEVRVLILRGGGSRAFSAGADISEGPMTSPLVRVLSIAIAICSVPLGASAEPTSTRACLKPDALRPFAGESLIRHGDRRFDAVPADASVAAAPVSPAIRGVVRRVDVPGGEKLVALTFDLCERQGEVAGYDGAILDYLQREGIKATLFAGGKWMRSHDARAIQLLGNPLFEIANHGDTHKNLRVVDADIRRREILGPQATYAALRKDAVANRCIAPGAVPQIAGRPRLFRFPYGACDRASMDAVNDAGLVAIQWDVATGDPVKEQGAEAIARAMVQGVRPGSIVVSHANGRGWHSAEALPIAIPKLKAMGYTFVTVSELLARGKPVIEQSCYNQHPGDTNRYDFLFAGGHLKSAMTRMRVSTSRHKKKSGAYTVARAEKPVRRRTAKPSKLRTVRATGAPRKPAASRL